MSSIAIAHTPSYLEKEEADTLFQILLNTVVWEKVHYFKRHVSHYEFNVPMLNEILHNMQLQFSKKVSGAFLNYYEDGNEYAPYHADQYHCDSCLLSLGTTRTLRYKENNTKENTDYVLQNGDLLFVPDAINATYKHSLLQTKKVHDPRISILVFF